MSLVARRVGGAGGGRGVRAFGDWPRARALVEGAGVDVPGVIVLGGVFEGLELVAASSLGQGLEAGLLVVEAGDAAGSGVDDDSERGILHGVAAGFEVCGECFLASNGVEDFV